MISGFSLFVAARCSGVNSSSIRAFGSAPASSRAATSAKVASGILHGTEQGLRWVWRDTPRGGAHRREQESRITLQEQSH